MHHSTRTILEDLAIASRFAMVAIFCAFFVAMFCRGQPVNAATPVGAATGYISFTVKPGANSKFYVTDTERQTICAYTLNGDQLRLVSVRKFDQDLKIVDASLKAPVAIEGTPGVTYDQAQQYARNIRPTLEALAKKYNDPGILGD